MLGSEDRPLSLYRRLRGEGGGVEAAQHACVAGFEVLNLRLVPLQGIAPSEHIHSPIWRSDAEGNPSPTSPPPRGSGEDSGRSSGGEYQRGSQAWGGVKT